MKDSEKKEITNLYKEAYPETKEADSGYIFPDGTLIDISSKGTPYCHGFEFNKEPGLMAWKGERPSLPVNNRMAVDAIMGELGAIEFTIDNCHMQCVRLPNKPLTAAQRQPLVEIIGRILERGSIKVEVLGTDRFAEYDSESNDVQDVMRKIERL